MSTFPDDWKRKCEITIQHDEVDESVTEFAVLLTEDCVPSEMLDSGDANSCQNGGGDLRFSTDSAGTTQVACEVVSCITDASASNRKLEVWVKMAVDAVIDKTLYIWYSTTDTDSQPAITDTYGAENVWESNAEAVYHFEDHSNVLDSTDHSNDLTELGSGIVDAEGKFGSTVGGYQGDGGTGSYQNTSPSITGKPWTYMAWIKPDSISSGVRYGIIELGTGSTGVGTQRLMQRDSRLRVNIGTSSIDKTGVMSVGTWSHAAATWNSSTNLVSVYHNAGSPATGTANTTTTSVDTLHVGDDGNGGHELDGTMDEARIYSRLMTQNEIATIYNNQNAPASFAVEGTPEDGPGAGSGGSIVPQIMNHRRQMARA